MTRRPLDIDLHLSHLHQNRQCLRMATAFWENSHETRSEPRMLLMIRLDFDIDKIYLSVDGNDSLVIDADDHLESSLLKCKDISMLSPWTEALNNPLLWSWLLTNQQGYTDGLQLEFAKNVSQRSAIVQIIAEGGEIKIRKIPSEFVRFNPGY